MSRFTIFGAGNMGSAIGGVVADGGAEVEHITDETPQGSAINGDIVVLAVPYPALADIVATYGDQLAGKIVVDITNPINFETLELLPAAGSSAAAEVAASLPNSKVLKAFNTTFAATLASKTVGDKPTTVLIAGDDTDAKAALASAITAGGVRAIDAGPLAFAGSLEAMGQLQLALAMGEKIGWTGGFAIVE